MERSELERLKALQDVLRSVSDNVDLVDRITITLRPAKVVQQGTDEPKKQKKKKK